MNLSKNTESPMVVKCRECRFSQVVTFEDHELPAVAVIEHGKETGHTLSTGPVDEETLAEHRTK